MGKKKKADIIVTVKTTSEGIRKIVEKIVNSFAGNERKFNLLNGRLRVKIFNYQAATCLIMTERETKLSKDD